MTGNRIKIFGGLGHGVIFACLPELINAAVTRKYVSTRWDTPLEFMGASHHPGIEDIEEFRERIEIFYMKEQDGTSLHDPQGGGAVAKSLLGEGFGVHKE